MTRFNPALGVGLAALALASCSKSAVEPIPPAEYAAAVDATGETAGDEQIVITGERIRRPNLESSMPIIVIDAGKSAGRSAEAVATPAPPPPPSW